MFKKRIRYFSILVRMGGVCYHAAISAKRRVERGDCLAPNTERRMRAKRQVLESSRLDLLADREPTEGPTAFRGMKVIVFVIGEMTNIMTSDCPPGCSPDRLDSIKCGGEFLNPVRPSFSSDPHQNVYTKTRHGRSDELSQISCITLLFSSSN